MVLLTLGTYPYYKKLNSSLSQLVQWYLGIDLVVIHSKLNGSDILITVHMHLYMYILWLSCLRVEDWSKGKHSTLLELKDHLFREPRVADHTHGLRVNFSNELLDNWHHVHSAAGVGVNEKWSWVELVHKAEDIRAVCPMWIPRLPEDSQLRAMLLAQKRETWAHS